GGASEDHREPGPRDDQVSPAVPPPRSRRTALRAAVAEDPSGIDAMAERRQNRRQKGQRQHEREQSDEIARRADRPEVARGDGEERRESNADREGGHQQGVAGFGDAVLDRASAGSG